MNPYVNVLLLLLFFIGGPVQASDRQAEFPEEYVRLVEFHGHNCPGLVKGYLAVKVAQRYLQEGKASGEAVTPIVEGRRCGLDAIQFLLKESSSNGNTLGNRGKGLVILDYGKDVWIFIRDRDQKALRAALKPGAFDHILKTGPDVGAYNTLSRKVRENKASEQERQQFLDLKQQRIARMLLVPEEKVFDLRWLDKKSIDALKASLPQPAKSGGRIQCAICREEVYEKYTKVKNGRKLCVPCFNDLQW